MPALILATPRTQLRPVQEGDFIAFRDMLSDPLTQRFERDDLSEERIRESFTLMLQDRDDPSQTRRRWMILLPPEDAVRGWVHLDLLFPRTREYEIGWLVQREHWGQGIATEAARAVLDFAFRILNAHRVVAFCHAQNAASERIMLKLGMKREGLLRQTRLLNNEWCDELVYAILESDPWA
jgi:RimJ/RimL family protein N-acetyltransferase